MSAAQIAVIVVLAVIIVLFVDFFLLTYFLYAVTLKRRALIGEVVNHKFMKNLESYGIDYSWWKNQKVETFEIETDVKLKGFYVENPNKKTNKFAIIIHGYFSWHMDMTIQSKFFQEEGYNIFCPDLRAHGHSGGKTVGMGYLDMFDMQEWIKFLLNKFGKDIKIVIFGWSMGGATALMLAGNKLPSNVKCVISDCAYTSAYQQFISVLKRRRLWIFPSLFFTNMAARMYGGYFLKDANPQKDLENANLPILFIHGAQDSFVDVKMCDELVKSKKNGYKRKEIFSNAEHCKSYISNPDRYLNIIKDFIFAYVD